MKALALKFGWQTKQLPDHFLLKGKPLKLSTLQSGGHESDSIHKEAVEELIKKSSDNYDSSEWEFPKGRRNKNETN